MPRPNCLEYLGKGHLLISLLSEQNPTRGAFRSVSFDVANDMNAPRIGNVSFAR